MHRRFSLHTSKRLHVLWIDWASVMRTWHRLLDCNGYGRCQRIKILYACRLMYSANMIERPFSCPLIISSVSFSDNTHQDLTVPTSCSKNILPYEEEAHQIYRLPQLTNNQKLNMRTHLMILCSLAYIANSADLQAAAPTPIIVGQRLDCDNPPEWGRCWKNKPDDLCSCVLKHDAPIMPIMTAAPDLSKRAENWNCFGFVGSDGKTSFTCAGGNGCSAGRDGMTSCVG